MRRPRRRIWLYVPDVEPASLEVTLLGQMDDTAPMYASIKSVVDRWHGWKGVQAIGTGSSIAVLAMALTRHARHYEPIAEWLWMWSSELEVRPAWRAVEWSAASSAAGMVGTW